MFFRVDRGTILLVESLEVCILKTSLYAKGAGGGKKVNESAYRPWFFSENVHPMFVLRSRLLR